MGGWLEKWGLKLISTTVVVEVEVGVELGKNEDDSEVYYFISEVSHQKVFPYIHVIFRFAISLV